MRETRRTRAASALGYRGARHQAVRGGVMTGEIYTGAAFVFSPSPLRVQNLSPPALLHLAPPPLRGRLGGGGAAAGAMNEECWRAPRVPPTLPSPARGAGLLRWGARDGGDHSPPPGYQLRLRLPAQL